MNIKITAKISGAGDLRMDQDGSFEDEDDCAIYLAIVDDEGNERALSEDGEASVEVQLNKAPLEAYTFRYDEAANSYEYIAQNDGTTSFDSYSFGIRGECNANADWSGISASPKVTVTWSVDPVYPDDIGSTEADKPEDEEKKGEEAEASSSDTETEKKEGIETDQEQAEENRENADTFVDRSSGISANDAGSTDTGTVSENGTATEEMKQTETDADHSSGISGNDAGNTDTGTVSENGTATEDVKQTETDENAVLENKDTDVDQSSGISAGDAGNTDTDTVTEAGTETEDNKQTGTEGGSEVNTTENPDSHVTDPGEITGMEEEGEEIGGN